MNKNLSIIIGLAIGVIFGGGLAIKDNFVAHGEQEGEIWNQLVAKGESFSWRDVFGGNNGAKDLYLLVYKKLQEDSKNEAVLQVARNNGFTPEEMEAILGGSLTPIFNQPDATALNMTQSDAFLIATGIREDFEFARELMQIAKEVEVAVMPSEIFANGDLSDSGFDLVRDLEIIEEILFAEIRPLTVGGIYDSGLVSPYDAVSNVVPDENFAVSNTPVAIARMGLKVEDVEENDDGLVINLGDEKVEVKVLEADICVPRDGLTRAISSEENDDSDEGLEGILGDGGNRRNNDESDGGDGIEGNGIEVLNEIKAAPADDWVQAWCPGFANTSSAIDNFSEENVNGFLEGFTSLGGKSPSPLFASFGSNYRSDNFQANAALCLTITQVREVYRSYNPGKSCIACEINRINQNLDRTLVHSLVPNKATGNLLESAKCKDVGSLFSMQFVTIWNPIPTPAHDDLIFGNNIFEEWNEFADRYKPLIIDEVKFDVDDAKDTSANGVAEILTRISPTGISSQDLYNEVMNTVAGYQAEALRNLRSYQNANEAAGFMMYESILVEEMKQMNSLFNSFNDLLININEVTIPEIKGKPDLG